MNEEVSDRVVEVLIAFAVQLERPMSEVLGDPSAKNYGQWARELEKAFSPLINQRKGFYHNHSGRYECGMAYQSPEPFYGGSWQPCSKLLNHKGKCGYEDNTAY